jgi:galactose mutarotase-like enzyme
VKLPFRSRAERPAPRVADYGFVEIRGGDSKIVCIPSIGGRIVEMWLAGRQWLWSNPLIPFAPPQEGTNYVETADSGGYDECFPTISGCRVPGWVRGWGGLDLPDHGELWSQIPELEIETGTDGQSVVTTWEGRRLPYRLTRLARVTPDGCVVMTYHAVNDAADRIPFIWAAHPLFPLTERTQVLLPEGAPMRVQATHKLVMGDARSLHHWPFVRAAGRVLDFLTPFNAAREYACKLFLDMPVGRARLREGDVELEVTFDTREVGQFGLWLNKQGWTPFRKRDSGYLNLALEPCIGAPDSLSDALGDWKRAQWLEPGEVRSWSTTWRGRLVPPPVEGEELGLAGEEARL